MEIIEATSIVISGIFLLILIALWGIETQILLLKEALIDMTSELKQIQ